MLRIGDSSFKSDDKVIGEVLLFLANESIGGNLKMGRGRQIGNL